MKVGLIDVDGHNFPNLPLMKLSAWHKKQGDTVEWYQPLWGGYCDRVYMSKVFSFTPDYAYHINAGEVIKGGSGYCIDLEDGKEVYHAERDKNLEDEIEHIYPDYALYGETERAIGFTTRGCPRGCGFCHVASKEGKCSYKVANIDEFWNGQKEICLCDPNLLACKDHIDILQQLVDSKAKIDFNQGLDIRMVTDKNLELLRQCKPKTIHFAYDRYEDKNIIEPKLSMFKEATGYGRGKVLVYILCNFSTTLEEDLERIAFVRSLGFSPYVTVYDLAHANPIYKKLQRWCNNYYVFWAEPDFNKYQKR